MVSGIKFCVIATTIHMRTPAGSNLLAAIPLREPPNRGPPAPFDQLLRLDSVTRPGLSGLEFRELFVRCRCGKITTRRVFKEHICAIIPDAPASVVIDLTGSSSDNSDGEPLIDLTSNYGDESLVDLTGNSDDSSLIDLTSTSDD